MMKNCRICKKEFNPKPNQKCCSLSCSKINDSNRLKVYYKNHSKEIKIYLKQYNVINKEKIKQKRKEYKIKNNQKIKNTNKIYQLSHKKEANDYHRNRLKRDINFKLRCNLSKRIWNALKGVCKSKNTVLLLGCSIEFLKVYIAFHFSPGMTWNNYGKWHIDHIKPCAKFDLSKPNEQRKCFNYTNLQPLWAKDNLIKNCF